MQKPCLVRWMTVYSGKKGKRREGGLVGLGVKCILVMNKVILCK